MAQAIPPPDKRQPLRDALWSVYYHSVFGIAGKTCDERVRPLPLVPAIHTLLASWDEHDDKRRRAALVWLASYAGADPAQEELEPGEAESIRHAIDALSVSVHVNPETLQRAARKDLEAMTVQFTDDGKLPPSEVLSTVYAASTAACKVLPISLSCCTSAGPLRTTGTVLVRVQRTLDELKLALDPQNWATCSDVFLQSHVVDAVAGGFPRRANPPTPGTSWDGLLLERVVVGTMLLDNVLKIQSKVEVKAGTTTAIHISYTLVDNPAAVVGGVAGAGILTMDSGYIEAKPGNQAGWSDVTIQKILRFKTDVLNMAAHAMLFLWLSDASQIGPCC